MTGPRLDMYSNSVDTSTVFKVSLCVLLRSTKEQCCSKPLGNGVCVLSTPLRQEVELSTPEAARSHFPSPLGNGIVLISTPFRLRCAPEFYLFLLLRRVAVCFSLSTRDGEYWCFLRATKDQTQQRSTYSAMSITMGGLQTHNTAPATRAAAAVNAPAPPPRVFASPRRPGSGETVASRPKPRRWSHGGQQAGHNAEGHTTGPSQSSREPGAVDSCRPSMRGVASTGASPENGRSRLGCRWHSMIPGCRRWPASRLWRLRPDPRDRAGNPNTAPSTNVGSAEMEYRPTPSPERPHSGKAPPYQMLRRVWTTPVPDVPQRATPKQTPKCSL